MSFLLSEEFSPQTKISPCCFHPPPAAAAGRVNSQLLLLLLKMLKRKKKALKGRVTFRWMPRIVIWKEFLRTNCSPACRSRTQAPFFRDRLTRRLFHDRRSLFCCLDTSMLMMRQISCCVDTWRKVFVDMNSWIRLFSLDNLSWIHCLSISDCSRFCRLAFPC